MKKSKTAAIRHARTNVSTLAPCGGSWYYTVWRPECNAWSQSTLAYFHRARVWRAQALLDTALEAMGSDRAVQYDGGDWTSYLPATNPNTENRNNES